MPITVGIVYYSRPEPGPGEIRIRVVASALNRADIVQRNGRYPVAGNALAPILYASLCSVVSSYV